MMRARSAALIAVLICACSVPSAAATQGSPPSPPRPNIVWISNEDMSPHLGAYGDALARTPVLDRLATESVRFTRAFTTAPVCAPSRAAIITGIDSIRLQGKRRNADGDYDATIVP